MSKCEEGKFKRKPLLLQAGSASSEDSGDHLLQACWQTMQTGFILAIRATKAIGATMATLEIMLTMASPWAVAHKEEVEEVEEDVEEA